MSRVVSATCTACSTACTWVLHVLDNTHAHAKNTSRLVYRKKRWLPLCWIQAVGHCIILAAHAYANTHTPHTNMHKTHHQLACRSRSGVPLSHDEASCRIQAAVRGFIWRQRIKKESEHELIFVGMKPKVLCSIHILKRPFFLAHSAPSGALSTRAWFSSAPVHSNLCALLTWHDWEYPPWYVHDIFVLILLWSPQPCSQVTLKLCCGHHSMIYWVECLNAWVAIACLGQEEVLSRLKASAVIIVFPFLIAQLYQISNNNHVWRTKWISSPLSSLVLKWSSSPPIS